MNNSQLIINVTSVKIPVPRYCMQKVDDKSGFHWLELETGNMARSVDNLTLKTQTRLLEEVTQYQLCPKVNSKKRKRTLTN